MLHSCDATTVDHWGLFLQLQCGRPSETSREPPSASCCASRH